MPRPSTAATEDTQMRRPLAALLAALAALTLLAAPASAAAPFPSQIDLPNGW